MATTNTEVGQADASQQQFPPLQTETYPSQLLWLALTFGLFYYLMAKVALPRISSILEVRSDRIAQDLDEANRLKEESNAAHAAYEQELAEAKSKAHAIAQDARDSAKSEVETTRAGVEAEMAARVAEAEKRISATKAKAMGEVGKIAEDTTAALLSEIMGGKTTKAEIASAVSGVKR
ncbi:F0F1 ATP synthase subunit B [Pseudahrensia aquimaris]|uniref:ATP synthase subunit b n=1 Tax=Pseudahrensia aquimaris TaxID=744461 RepID=A0ABW3FI24_9HYPH